MKPADLLSGLRHSRLKELLSYDPATGVFEWCVSRSALKAGAEAGTINAINGYRLIKLDGRNYLAHRLAFFYMTGAWPSACIDHANLNKADNRWENLREASATENARNRGLTVRNTTGLKGVSRSRGKWQANIRIAGHLLYLGRHPSPELAHAAYAAAAARHFGAFGRAA